jgi:hypothetical protein
MGRRPVGYGMMLPLGVSTDRFMRTVAPEHRSARWNRAKRLGTNQSHRALRDRPHFWPIPGNKLPGYDHNVPTGHSFAFGVPFYSITGCIG